MNFSNKGSFDDPSVYLKDLLKESISTSTTLSMEKTKYGKYSEERTEFIDFIEGRLDLSKKRAFAGVDQEVVIDERGILLTDTSDIDRQVKLIGDLITFTNDGWNTAGTAISSEGVVGEAIYGKVLAGADLTIENTSGTFEVDQNGVTIHGANLTITNGLPTSELSGENLIMDNTSYNGVKINSTDGITVRTNDVDISGTIKTSLNASEGIKIQYHNGSEWLDRFKVDSTTGDLIAHNMQLKGGQVINSAGKAVIDLDSGVLNWDELTINGKIDAAQIENLVVGQNVTMGSNAVISWSNITGTPSIPSVPSYIHSTYISKTEIKTPKITSGTINSTAITSAKITSAEIISSLISTRANGSDSGIEIDDKGIISYSSESTKDGFSLSQDGQLEIWVEGKLIGHMYYDGNGNGITEAKERMFINTCDNYALKIGSDTNISIQAVDTIYFEGDVEFDGDVLIRGNLSANGIGGGGVAVFG